MNKDPDFHYPFCQKDNLMLFFSYCLWCVNIFQVVGIGLTLSILIDLGATIPESAKELGMINIAIGGGIILCRVIGALKIVKEGKSRKWIKEQL